MNLWMAVLFIGVFVAGFLIGYLFGIHIQGWDD